MAAQRGLMTREQRLEDLLKRVMEENDHNVSTKGLVSTLSWSLAVEIQSTLAPKPENKAARLAELVLIYFIKERHPEEEAETEDELIALAREMQ